MRHAAPLLWGCRTTGTIIDMKTRRRTTRKNVLSISAAARRFGKDRTAIQRKIRGGELEKEAGPDGQQGVTLDSLIRIFGKPKGTAGPATNAAVRRMRHPAAHSAAGVRHTADEPPADLLAVFQDGHAREIAAKDAHIASLERELDRSNTEKGELRQALQLEQQKTAKMLMMIEAPREIEAPIDVAPIATDPPAEKVPGPAAGNGKARKKGAVKPAGSRWSRMFGG